MTAVAFRQAAYDYQPISPYRVLAIQGESTLVDHRHWYYELAVAAFAKLLPPLVDTTMAIIDGDDVAVLMCHRQYDTTDSWWAGCDRGFAQLERHIDKWDVRWYRTLAALSLPDSVEES